MLAFLIWPTIISTIHRIGRYNPLFIPKTKNESSWKSMLISIFRSTSILGRFYVNFFGGCPIWLQLHQPSECTNFWGKSFNITIDLHQVCDPKKWVPFTGCPPKTKAKLRVPETNILLDKILHQGWWLSHYLQGFNHPNRCRISSINSSSTWK